ncbi:esterase [Actinoplanes italicus]|uniref:Platelet-activating factor acetylhydrolase isoform II n=1 Tax=Actinoplanes italicus TaxID=113567 RepID=A0A2T0K1W4_9ACTN|nr:alpha/beta hydrolase [Actinoplanes italicus]PRX16792.1 platelet-activating factor acetylhydrolase isoform II [Actinoplanes italicus]GIE31075.1 esterase [Actinoplanes italicus]
MGAFLTAVVVAAGLLGTGAVPAATAEPLALTAPTGRHPVGATELHLKDTSRSDPWVPEQAFRELMVTVWYPAKTSQGTRVQYLSPEESRLITEGKRLDPAVPREIFSTVATHAVAGAAPAGRAHSLPLIVLSPGWTQPMATLSGLAEDLASHGYVVAGIQHTYETYAVTFPDGRITGCVACELDDDRTFFGKLYRGRAADVSFVIDELTGRDPAWRGGRLIDPSRIGAAGHSAGGASALAAMAGDRRIDAAIDIDGTTDTGGDPVVPATGVRRPFVVLSSADHGPDSEDQWLAADYGRAGGWKRWLTVAGTDHASFTDLGVFADQLGIDIGQTITGERATEITRRYVRATFDQHLRHRHQPLLSGASTRYPEVAIAAR